MANSWGNNGNSEKLYFFWSPKSLQMVTAAMQLKDTCSLEEMTNTDSILKSRDFTVLTKICLVKAMFFPVVMYGCESWTITNNERWIIDAFELWCWRRFKSSLYYKKIKPVNSKGNQSWILTGRTDAEAETPILWPPDAKNWLIGKSLGAGKDWRPEEKGTIEDEMVGWHPQFDGYEFEQAPGSWWRTGRLDVRQSMGSWGVGHDWATELNCDNIEQWFLL